MIWTLPCACGSTVTADRDDPTPGVAHHRGSEPHASYSTRTSIAPRPMPGDSTAVQHVVDLSVALPVRPVRKRVPRGRVAVR